MISLETIQRMNREAARRAEIEGKRPSEVLLEDWLSDKDYLESGKTPTLYWPNLAPEYVEQLYPGEYEEVDTLFVDKTGWDRSGPALHISTLIDKGIEMTREHGTLYWTIHSEGQFQIYVTAFRKVK